MNQQKGAAMYRSSVRKFIQSVLSLLDEGRDLSFEQIAELSEYTIADILAKLRVERREVSDAPFARCVVVSDFRGG